MKKTTTILLSGALLFPSAAALAGDNYRAQAIAVIKRDFHDKGQATIDRLENDAVQHVCNKYSNTPPEQLQHFLQNEQMATVRYPADGKLMGDWKAGEKLAQSGAGFTWTDRPGLPVGGNCYNCHEISPKELSFGTLGPSLRNFAKTRGNTADMQKYVYSKIYNSKAYNLCSAMPRFGHIGALTEQQIKDLVALILDPASPANQ